MTRQILDAAVDYAVVAFDLQGRITDWSEGAHRLLGWTEQEMRGEPAGRFFTVEDRAANALQQDIDQVLSTGRAQAARWHLRRDGERFWATGETRPLHDDHGRAVGLVTVLRDHTDEHRAAEALQQSEQRLRVSMRALADSEAQFRTFAQSLPNHVWTAPADGLLDWFNDRVYAYSGEAAGTLDGQAWGRIVHPDDMAGAAARWGESLRTGTDYETEFRIRRADGHYRWHLVRAIALRNSEGQVSRWIGTNTDVHEGKLAHAELSRDRDRIWSLSQELMLVCDFAGRITTVNPAATRLLGWSHDEMAGRLLSDYTHADDGPLLTQRLGGLQGGATRVAFESRLRDHGGHFHLMSWTGVSDGGRVHAVARDITRERVQEEAMHQSQKLEAIGHLTGGVAHDFNNVLAVIRNSTELLRRLPATDARRDRFMDAISDAVVRASKLTGQLLAFARRQALRPEVFDAVRNTRLVSDMITTLAGARVALVLDLPDQPCWLLADPHQFDTALINLAVNARDAMEDQGGMLTIRITPATTTADSAFVALSMTDTGCGIAPEHLSQIFEPFFTTKATGHGTGLGLSQVFGFAKQSGGDVRVASALGAGSTFTLVLPGAEPPAVPPLPSAAARALALGQGQCILVVEDNVHLSHSVEQSLQQLHYVTEVVDSAERALQVLAATPGRFAAVFSDVVMTGMNGVDMALQIRRLHGALPVVLSSGYSYALAQNPHHGFPLLSKPYSLEELAQVLDEALRRG